MRYLTFLVSFIFVAALAGLGLAYLAWLALKIHDYRA
jgi:hypothetical protein